MRNRIFLSVMLIMLMFSTGSCVMHYERAGRTYGGDGYRAPKHHWGNSGHHSVRSAYWGKHRYGPRPHNYRGTYR